MAAARGTSRLRVFPKSILICYRAQSVPPSRLPTLLGGILEPDHLATIYATLSARHAQAVKDDGLVREYMQALRRIPRWQMTESLLLPDERKMGKALWNALEL